MKVIIASKNPVKREAVVKAFEKCFNETTHFDAVDVPSGVSDQPMSDDETREGAFNRAQYARAADPDADYWVGIEGGVQPGINGLHAFAWIVIIDKTMKGEARTTTFQLPDKVKELVNRGIELGTADDIVFSQRNSKQRNGAVGLLTNNVITRSTLYCMNRL